MGLRTSTQCTNEAITNVKYQDFSLSQAKAKGNGVNIAGIIIETFGIFIKVRSEIPWFFSRKKSISTGNSP